MKRTDRSSPRGAKPALAPARRDRPSADPAKPEESAAGTGSYERIYAVVRRIPKGRIATYGQIAEVAGLANHARQVGYALSSVGQRDDVPWQRVVNARGEVSLRSGGGWDEIQRSLLEDEGVEIDARGRIDLTRYRWKPRGAAKSERARTSRSSR